MRIRRAIVSHGTQVLGLANIEFNDNNTFDRSNADNQYSGKPIETIRAGSGTLEFLYGGIGTGYATSNLVATYYEVSQTNGVETVSTKTATFADCTFNRGFNIPAEGVGRVKVAFDYSTCTIA